MKSKNLARTVSVWSVFCLLCALSSCKEDTYYERPSWLEPPIYEVLKADGTFSRYLQAVDRTSYASVLQGAGLYTVFAPNDSAFGAFLQEQGYGSVNDIPDDVVDRIVAYSICNSTFVFDSLGVGGGFKYKTQYYALPYRDPEFNNEWVVDQTTEGGWTASYNNYKFLPVFTTAFFQSYNPALTASDYAVFFPSVAFTGKSIQGGQVLRSDLRAENGIIHEVSTVNLPLKNISDIISEPEHSLFKSLVDAKDDQGNYLFRTYYEVTDPATLKTLQKIRPNDDIKRIYIKYYNDLAYSLNLENVLDYGTSRYTPEKAGYTLILPTENALRAYMDNRVLKYYKPGDVIPTEIIRTLVNAHMTNTLVWPANYESSLNDNGDFLNGVGSSGPKFGESAITGGTLASNGFVFHSNEVVKSRLFESVYSEIFLNPAHAWSNTAYVNFFNNSLREDLQKCALNGFISERYTLLAFDDSLLIADGFNFNPNDNSFSHNDLTVTNSNNRLSRLLREHVFPGLNNGEINSEITSFSTSGISQYNNWNFTVTSYGDPIRFKDNQLQAAGNIEDNTYVTVNKLDETYLNGTVWKTDGLLEYSPRKSGVSDKRYQDLSLWEYLDRARVQNPNVAMFVAYAKACVKKYPDDDSSTEMENISPEQFYTVLMPNQTAMQSAINAGVLPPLDRVNAANPEDFAKAASFIYSHIIQGRVFVDDNIRGYLYPVNEASPNRALVPVVAKVNATVTVDGVDVQLTNQSLLLEVSKAANGLLNFVPQNVTMGSKVLVQGTVSGTVRVQRGSVVGSPLPNNFRSNRIACRAVLHEVNNYINFKVAK